MPSLDAIFLSTTSNVKDVKAKLSVHQPVKKCSSRHL